MTWCPVCLLGCGWRLASFDLKKGTRFSTMASMWIAQHIMRSRYEGVAGHMDGCEVGALTATARTGVGVSVGVA